MLLAPAFKNVGARFIASLFEVVVTQHAASVL
jgi:hypothetical protein